LFGTIYDLLPHWQLFCWQPQDWLQLQLVEPQAWSTGTAVKVCISKGCV
jgi:hypothetical protein